MSAYKRVVRADEMPTPYQQALLLYVKTWNDEVGKKKKRDVSGKMNKLFGCCLDLCEIFDSQFSSPSGQYFFFFTLEEIVSNFLAFSRAELEFVYAYRKMKREYNNLINSRNRGGKMYANKDWNGFQASIKCSRGALERHYGLPISRNRTILLLS